MLANRPDDELDTGPRASRDGVARMCALTRAVRPVDELIRFVVAPDGAAVPDLKRNLPGRGLWVTASRDALAEAVRRKAFPRGFKREVRVSDDFVQATERLLERSALDALAVAGKAGQAVAGFVRVTAAIARGPLTGLVHASDAAADGIRKIEAACRAQKGDEAARIATIRAFSSAQLDLALGRSNVVHAALLAGAATDTFIARHLRLERFRTGSPGGQDMKSREIETRSNSDPRRDGA